MKVINISDIGPEIIKAITERNKKAVQEYNIRQAQKYLNYALNTGDTTLINYAKNNLNNTTL